MRVLAALGFTTNILFAGVGLSLLMVVIGRVAESPAILLGATLPVLVAVAAGAAHWAIRRPSRMAAAARVDLDLDFRERLSTMVHLDQNPTGRKIDAIQRSDTEQCAGELPIERVSPVRVPSRARYLVLPAVLAAAALLYPDGTTQADGTEIIPPDFRAASGGGKGAAEALLARLTPEQRAKLAAQKAILENDALTDEQKLDKLRELGVKLPPRRKDATPGEILDDVRRALDPAPPKDEPFDRAGADALDGPDSAEPAGGGGEDGSGGEVAAPVAGGEEDLAPAARQAAAMSRAYPEFADVLKRYFGAGGQTAAHRSE